MPRWTQDLAVSFQSLRRSRGFTTIAVLTLALGIAGNILIFSVINATLINPLPYPSSDRIVVLRWQDQGDVPASAFFLVANRARSFSSVSAFYPVEVGVNISAIGQPQYVKALPVSGDYFQTLGISPWIGDVFHPEQDQPGAPRTAVLSYRLWEKSFSGDASAIGRDLMVNGEIHKIIGVMPRSFWSYPDADLWLPLQLNPNEINRGSNYRVIARLANGIPLPEAQHELDQLAREYHLTYLPSAPRGALVADEFQAFLMSKHRQGLAILFAAVAFVFLIACTNVAVLILVRAAATNQAIAVRAALGPTRGRLVQFLLTESFLLSLMGGLLGLILAKECLPLILSFWPSDLPRSAPLHIDGHVLSFTVAISLLSPLIFGLAPALKLSRINIARMLARTSRTASASAEQVRAVRLLVFGQTALTVMLLAGTMLLLRSLVSLYRVPLGFASDRLLIAQLSLAGERYRTSSTTTLLINQIVDQIRALPGVDSVAAVDSLPLEKGLNLPIHPEGMPELIDHADEYRPVTPGYFQTLGIPLRVGRPFSREDSAGGTPVAIVNEVLARRWWPGASALGHHIRVSDELGPQFTDTPRQIVGVVADIHEKGLGLPPPPTVFVPMAQAPDTITSFCNKVFLTSIVIHTSSPADLSLQIRNAVHGVDPNLPLASLHPFTEVINDSLASLRFVVLLTAAFSAFALFLTAVGIYGLLSYQTRLRSHEIAVRMVLGANRFHIVGMVVQQGTKLVMFAILAGLSGTLLIRNLLANLLYNVQSSSLVVIIATGLLLGLIATLVSLLTAIRAASTEPVAVLRNE